MIRHSAVPRIVTRAILAALLGPAVRTVGAQLTLSDALRQADQSAYGNRVARGNAAAQEGLAIAPLQGILGNIRVEGGYVRTTDPIGVFGDRLRQGIITQADFDPARLNHPGAMGNYQTDVVAEQPLFNADAWAARTAANHGASAGRAVATWARLSARVDVIRAYYGAVLASERAGTLQAASRSAHAHVAQTEAMVRQGLVTRSDALLASVRAGDIDTQLAEADGSVETARRQLAIVLGRPQADLVDIVVLHALPSADRIRAVVSHDSSSSAEPRAEGRAGVRADVRAALEGSAAARSDAVRARATYLPRINSFARYDWNSSRGLYVGERNWTVGVMATWNPFGSVTELSDVRATSGRAAVARAQAEAAEAQATLEVAQTRIALSVALIRLRIAEQSVHQSAEAHRIVSRKYEGGLAGIVELLDAQAAETQSALGLSAARYSVIVAAAENCRALGGDPATLAVLDEGNNAPMVIAAPSRDSPSSATKSDAQRPR